MVAEEREAAVVEGAEMGVKLEGGAVATAGEAAATLMAAVAHSRVVVATEEASVEFDGGVTSVEAIMEAAEDAGFDVERIAEQASNVVQLRISGMTCSACTTAVEKGLSKLAGVHSVAVNLIRELAEVRGDPTFILSILRCPTIVHRTSIHRRGATRKT